MSACLTLPSGIQILDATKYFVELFGIEELDNSGAGCSYLAHPARADNVPGELSESYGVLD
eukprot:6785222-Pyramimonas_sp.AAC.1